VSRVSNLPAIDPASIDGSETVPVVKNGTLGRAPISTLGEAAASNAAVSANTALAAEEAARAALNPKADVAEGLATVADGEHFNVFDVGDELVSIYRKVSSVSAELIKTVFQRADIRIFGASAARADNSAQINAAMAAALMIWVPAAAFGCAGGVLKAQLEGQVIDGPGLIGMNSGETGALFDSNGKTVHIGAICFTANDTGAKNDVASPAADRSALLLDMDKASTLRGTMIMNFANRAILPRNETPSRLTTLSASDVSVFNCWKGYDLGVRAAEYTTWDNCRARGCREAVDLASGNINWTGGSINDNYDCLLITGTDVPNNGHSTVTGVLVNHADNALVAVRDVDLGALITNCQMFDGKITIQRSKGIAIRSNIIDATEWVCGGISDEEPGTNFVEDNTIIGAFANTVLTNDGGFISDTRFRRNYKPDGKLFFSNDVPEIAQTVHPGGGKALLTEWWESGSYRTDGFKWFTDPAKGHLSIHGFNAGELTTNPALTVGRIGPVIGFFGAPPVGQQSVSAAATSADATDLDSAIALVNELKGLTNSLRTALVNPGLAS